MLAGAAGTVSGYVREASIAFYYGTTVHADALSVVLFYTESAQAMLLTGVCGFALVPMLAERLGHDSERTVGRLVSGVALTLVIAVAPVAVLATVWPEGIAEILLPEASPALDGAMVLLIPSAAFGLMFIAAASAASGALQVRQRYAQAALAKVWYNLALVAAIVLAAGGSLRVAGVGLALGALATAVPQFLALPGSGVPFVAPGRIGPLARELARYSLPALTSLALVNVLMGAAQRWLMASAPEGALSSLNYAQRVVGLTGSLSYAVMTIGFTRLSLAEAGGEGLAARRTLFADVCAVGFFMLFPLTLFTAVLGSPLVSVLFERGRFTGDSRETTAIALGWFAASIVPGFLFGMLTRWFFAARRAAWANVMAAVWCGLTVSLTAVLLPVVGPVAVAISYSGGVLGASVLGLVPVARELQLTVARQVLEGMARVAVASAAAAAILLTFRRVVPEPPSAGYDVTVLLWLAMAAGLFAVAYLATARALREPHAIRIASWGRRELRRFLLRREVGP
jgi:putative peptidoglycan lipid II flippase